jgi:alpha-mannosidase
LVLLAGNAEGQAGKDTVRDHGYFTGGRINVVPSSHQDIAWISSPDKCIEYRDLHMITPALARLKENDSFRFSVEQGLNLYEYLDRHPDRLAEIRKYTLEGRLEWGATYNQPYESFYDGEALVRETYYGKKKLEKLIPGGKFLCAWSEDVPGRALQAPQIFAKAGIRYLQFSRFQPGLYNWYSPDGSHISCWSPGQYDDFGNPVLYARSDEERTKAFIGKLSQFNDYFSKRALPPNFIYINSQDVSRPIDYDRYFKEWNAGIAASGLPSMGYATGTEALEAATRGKGRIDSIMGERPNVWVYIHGPTHEKAVRAGRNASRLLSAAEKFSAIDASLEGNFSSYPQRSFDIAWQQAIYPDHGWGGQHGDITDSVFSQSYQDAEATGDSILRRSMGSITSKIRFRAAGIPVVVFNPLSWTRTDPVQFTVNTDGLYTSQFQLVDSAGTPIDYQLISSPHAGSGSYLSFVFVAAGVPSIGYKTYYLVPGRSGDPKAVESDFAGNMVESWYYKIELAKGGVRSIFDKQLQIELLDPAKFLGGEVFSLQSIGLDAGEFTDIQQPTMAGFEKMSQYAPEWNLLERGPVRTVLETAHLWRNCTVRERLTIYTAIKRIDFDVDLLGFDGERSREFRMAFPVNMRNGRINYEVPMGVVRVGESELPMAAGFSKPEQIYSTPCREVHPRECQDWFGASDGKASVTISSDVAVFDWVDPTASASEPGMAAGPVLQPILLATRRSCNGSSTAPWYLQRGDHHFHFSLSSHGGDWRSGWKSGKQGAEPMQVLVARGSRPSGYLPDQFSFAALDKENVLISAIKKCDDDDHLVFRCYELDGRDTDVRLKWFRGIGDLIKTNIIEEEGVSVPHAGKDVVLPVGKYSIETYKFSSGNSLMSANLTTLPK